MEETPTSCSPPQGATSKQERLKVKRRKRKERMKAARAGHWWEEDIPDSPVFDNSYDAYHRMRFGM